MLVMNWDDWAQALERSTKLFKHTLKFDSLVGKQDAIDYIQEDVPNVGDIDECLTEEKVTFLTDIELSKRQVRSLLLETRAVKYEEEEL